GRTRRRWPRGLVGERGQRSEHGRARARKPARWRQRVWRPRPWRRRWRACLEWRPSAARRAGRAGRLHSCQVGGVCVQASMSTGSVRGAGPSRRQACGHGSRHGGSVFPGSSEQLQGRASPFTGS
ncbi:unnamed protein product, partial [Prorocentrum cordatum]